MHLKNLLSPVVSTDISTQSFTRHSLIAVHFIKSGSFFGAAHARPDSEVETQKEKHFG